MAVLPGSGAVPAVRPSGPRGARRRRYGAGRWLITTLDWPPLVDGALPAFLASQRAYDGARYRVLYRPYVARAVGKAAAFRGWRRSRRPSRCRARARSVDSPRAVAELLAAQHACMVRFGDTVTGGYYAFGQVAQSRAVLDYRFEQLSRLAAGFRWWIYSPASGLSPTQFVAEADLGARLQGRDALPRRRGLLAAERGQHRHGRARRRRAAPGRDVRTAAQPDAARSAGRRFELVIDAAHAAGFQALSRLANVLLVATPASPFTYLPEVRENDPLVRDVVNPLHIPQLTDRLAFGIDRVIDSPLEVEQIAVARPLGQAPVGPRLRGRAGVLARSAGRLRRRTRASDRRPVVHFHGFRVVCRRALRRLRRPPPALRRPLPSSRRRNPVVPPATVAPPLTPVPPPATPVPPPENPPPAAGKSRPPPENPSLRRPPPSSPPIPTPTPRARARS